MSVVVSIANLFLANIIIFEATSEIQFNWERLLHSPLFWGIIIFNIMYRSAALASKQKEAVVDERVETAISTSSVDLITLATDAVKKGDYDSCNKVLKALKQIQKRRPK
ncbi:MAG: hypothetical protein IKX20_05020 [Paludibacteraceae bacterium]|nr:hypothetical protein [Paludibacteraceae bacterium]